MRRPRASTRPTATDRCDNECGWLRGTWRRVPEGGANGVLTRPQETVSGCCDMVSGGGHLVSVASFRQVLEAEVPLVGALPRRLDTRPQSDTRECPWPCSSECPAGSMRRGFGRTSYCMCSPESTRDNKLHRPAKFPPIPSQHSKLQVSSFKRKR